ncbi:MAG: Na+/H+ antiporter NhaC [Burkholderiales bacterium]|nr:Na+/H+ antiporter NhaC [Burkholderiales bacterium]MCE7875842.1 Na+/H+ antiporter NhaC [Betaproteobacteria bacterium PRO3]
MSAQPPTPAAPAEPLSLGEALIPIASLILLVALSFYLFGDAGAKGPNQVALVVATVIALSVARRRGQSMDTLRDAAIASVGSGMGAIFILFAVGALIGTWALSGTLAAMVYYGLQILNPHYFYATTVLICAIVSFAIGSSWTVVGTIGIGLMGIAASMNLDPAITAGAVISGSYFGDKSSPLSDTANLSAATAGADLYAHIKETAISSAVAVAIALAVFWTMGTDVDYQGNAKLAQIDAIFHVTPWHFAPLAVVVALALFKVPPFTTIFAGALVGGVIAVILAPERVAAFAAARDGVPGWIVQIKGVWLALASGYHHASGIAAIDTLVTRGGMERMLDTVWLIIVALAFGGVIEKMGALERLMAPVIAAAKSAVALVASLVGAAIATNIATADQYMAVVLPGRMFKGAFEKRGYAPTVLSRTIGDTATPTGALIPWNSCGAYMAVTLGVATVSYAPWAIFNMVSPLVAIAFAAIGFRMPRTAVSPQAPEAPDGPATGR